MCRHNKTKTVLVPIPADLSSTGVREWKRKPIDECIATVVAELNAAGIFTRTSCCGHGERDGEIVLDDGTVLRVPREWSLPSSGHPADPGSRFEEVLWRR